MSRVILQHWTGPLEGLALHSVGAMRAYALRMGVEHHVIRGDAFDSRLKPYCQKLAILNMAFDEYDNVAMLDCDMVPVRGLGVNLFDVPGMGFHQKEAHQRVVLRQPKLASLAAPYLGGCLYKFSREMRQRLRAEIDFAEMALFGASLSDGGDEGMVHRLLLRAGVPQEGAYLSDRWCWGSYWPNPGQAHMIHVRAKPTGDKWRNYQDLVARGIL